MPSKITRVCQSIQPKVSEEDVAEMRKFVQLVNACRSAQKQYFKTRSSSDLFASKEKEKELDEWFTEEPARQEGLF